MLKRLLLKFSSIVSLKDVRFFCSSEIYSINSAGLGKKSALTWSGVELLTTGTAEQQISLICLKDFVFC